MQTKIDVSMGNYPKAHQQGPQPQIRSLRELVDRIATKDMEHNLRQALIQEVCKYPEGSLDYVWDNINNIIEGIIRRNRDEN